MRYSATTGGFYADDIKYPNPPADLVAVDEATYKALIAAQSSGKVITADGNGNPQAVDRAGPTLQEQRDIAVLTRTAFCQRLWRAGVMTQAEAVQAARGEWPASFAAFAASLTADESADAQIEWAGAKEIRYMAPLLQSLALSYAGDDQAAATAILDQIFGIS